MIKGLVLAGGKSSRFGKDKALALYEGTSLLERAVDLLERMSLQPVVVTRGGAEYSFLKAPVVQDKLPEKGPLGGLYTAMSGFNGTDFLVLTCDMPLLNAPLLSALLSAYSDHRQTTVFRMGDGAIQPFPGIYTAGIFSLVQERVFRGELSLQGLLDNIFPKQVIDWQGQPHLFANVNRREDLESLSGRR
ncbi:MAG: molybdenum cofactor guanylyltransferase [Candidatus Omnitrophota bacterium]